jgi:hypothetical protein
MSRVLQNDEVRRLEVAFEHAWRYFALHSAQRTTVFNFFVASAGLTLSGLGYVLATSAFPRHFAVVAGLGAVLLAFTFWKLDQRVVQLIKASERVMIETERTMFQKDRRVFCIADEAPVNMGISLTQPWSYGRSFKTLFVMTALLGLAGAGTSLISLLRAAPGTAAIAKITKRPIAPVLGKVGVCVPYRTATPSNLVQ